MAVVQARIAPFINVNFMVTSEFWEQRPNHPHRGVDIATTISQPIYSMCNGTVIHKDYEANGYGYYCIIKSTDGDNYGYLFAHLDAQTLIPLNGSVTLGQYIADEGTSGSSTGIHLHLEMQDLTNRNWIYGGSRQDYLDPTQFMGIPNVEGTWCYYSGTPVPPTPTQRRNKFPWVLYANKIRNLTK